MKCIILIASLLLTGCATSSVRGVVTCQNARVAAALADKAIERFCPIQPSF